MDAKLKKLESKLQETYQKGREQNVFVGGYGGGHLQADSHEARRSLGAYSRSAQDEPRCLQAACFGCMRADAARSTVRIVSALQLRIHGP